MSRSGSGVLLVAVVCLLAACDSGNPVAPGPPPNPPVDGLTLTVQASPTTLTTSSTTPSMITVTAKKANGQAADDGAEVTLTTNLGSFTQSAEATQTIRQLLNKGSVQVPLYAGKETGTASILAQIGTSVGRGSVAIETPPPAPTPSAAEFTFVANGLAVTFTDASTGSINSWKWDFGDGDTSTDRNPVHAYRTSGTYMARLTVDGAGGKSERSKFVAVSTGPAVAASFDYEIDPTNNLKVQFFDRSTGDPTAWSWQFGDGTSSSERNPLHTYNTPRTYTVTLTVSNATSSGSVNRFVNTNPEKPAAPTANFDWAATGRSVQFVNQSTSGATVEWDFGDGTAKSTEQNPLHIYAVAGKYPVSLTATNAGGSATANKIVETDPVPAADFMYSIDASTRTVTFTDKSTNDPIAWKWRFGDGSLSIEQNPTHTYGTSKTYVVTLEATNTSGTGTIQKEVTIP